ncbi:hypothetical protein AC578_10635 [Pseudocercospora eumusae]|uniref:RRM domain-containing protein n=1 Tax=Pseudocercospora eumusae TaxID=321146 RepID=A0A139GTN5_9PEZI|nr:hypothetical protein AC578_10635 [Pseudocercospora eumusae]
MSSPDRRSVSRGRSRTPARPATVTSDNARQSNSRSNSRDHANGARDSRSRSRGRSDSRSRSRGRSRSISRSRSRSGSGSRGDQPRSAKIVIEKLTKNVNATHLREIFSTYGAIQELEMPMNKHFMTNRGIAYVLYSQASYAEAAIANMHEAQLDGALISVSIVLPRRRFSRSPPPMRPPPNRFGEPHRHRDGPPPLPSMRGRGGRRGSPGPPSRYGPPPRGGGPGGYRDRYDDRDSYRPRSYSRSRSPPMRRRSPSYSGRSRSPSRSPHMRGRGPPRGGGGGGRRRRSYSYSSYSSRSRSRSRDRGRGRR